MSSRLYIGNLVKQVTEEEIQALFVERNLVTDNILLKQGYAFVDCQDQTTVDSAIDKLAGLQLHDKAITVEPAVNRNGRNSGKAGCKLAVKGVPKAATDEEINDLLSQYGTVKEFSRQNESVHVTYSNAEEAQGAKEDLQGFELHGQSLKADLFSRRSSQRFTQPNQPKIEFALRVLVPHQYVGAIIGRSGQTIRQITQQTNARVDVVRRDNSMQTEKMVLIFGAQTENCIQACHEILKVINSESVNANLAPDSEPGPREPELKILAHNNLCGRLIGKQGVIIKSIMGETDTKIAVSSVNNVGPLNPDRVVTIKGTLEAMCSAATKIYEKLKSCYESDIQNPKYSNPPMLGGPPIPMHYNPWSPRPTANFMPTVLRGASAMPPHMPPPSPQHNAGGHMTCFLYIPKASVGAVIGTKGSYINYVKQESRASCQVQEDRDNPDAEERPVKITGYPDSIWKAQWYIFDKIKMEGFTTDRNSNLRCDVLVPKSMVGRIIGKGGRNVRHIQDISGASVKLPEEQSPEVEDIAVQVVGTIYCQTLAQALIRQLLTQGQLGAPMNEQIGLPHNANHHHYHGMNNGGGPRHHPHRPHHPHHSHHGDE